MTDNQENKTSRVQLLMAPSEVEMIDDWGFKNRIRTRAEAVRRLCQIGMMVDEQSTELAAAAKAAQDAATALADDDDISTGKRISDQSMERVLISLEKSHIALLSVEQLLAGLVELRQGSTLEDAAAAATAATAVFRAKRDQYIEAVRILRNALPLFKGKNQKAK